MTVVHQNLEASDAKIRTRDVSVFYGVKQAIDDAAAADGRAGAQHDAVAACCNDRCVEAQLREATCAHNPRERRGRPMVDDRARWNRRELLELDVEAVTRRVRARLHENIAALQISASDARQGDGDAGGRDGSVVEAPTILRPAGTT